MCQMVDSNRVEASLRKQRLLGNASPLNVCSEREEPCSFFSRPIRRNGFIMTARVAIVFLLIACSGGISVAQESGFQNNEVLLGFVSRLELMKEKAIKNIQDYENEIRKCDNTISKAENLVGRAKQGGNAQAEGIASVALVKATAARRNYQEMLGYEQFRQELLDKRLTKIRSFLEIYKVDKPDRVNTELDGDCKKLELQVEMDKRVIERYLKTNEMTDRDRTEWADESSAARKEAIKAAAQLLLTAWIEAMKKRAGNIQKLIEGFEQFKIKNIREALKNKDMIDLLSNTLEKNQALYIKLSKQCSFLENVEFTFDYWELANKGFELNQVLLEQGDRDVMDALQNSEVKSKLSEIGALCASALAKYGEEIEWSAAFMKKWSPWVSGLSSIINYIHAGVKFYLSAERLSQLDEITEQELAAMNALRKQSVRTMEKLKECQERAKKQGQGIRFQTSMIFHEAAGVRI